MVDNSLTTDEQQKDIPPAVAWAMGGVATLFFSAYIGWGVHDSGNVKNIMIN